MTHAWDAAEYDASFGFVTAYGAPLLDLLAAQPGERVLDLGCGTGHQAAALAAGGAEVVGLDADEDMLRVARAEHGGVAGLSFVAGDAAGFTPAEVGGQVDAVLSNAALHWMTDQAGVLGRVRAVLRDGGRFVAEMGGVGNVGRVRAALVAAVAEVSGLDSDGVRGVLDARSWFPTPGQQAALLEAAGFVVRRIELVDRPTPLTGTVADWCAHFRPDVLALGDRGDGLDAVRTAVDAQAAARGLDDGTAAAGTSGWWADYVRLRFVAVAGSGLAG